MEVPCNVVVGALAEVGMKASLVNSRRGMQVHTIGTPIACPPAPLTQSLSVRTPLFDNTWLWASRQKVWHLYEPLARAPPTMLCGVRSTKTLRWPLGNAPQQFFVLPLLVTALAQ